MDSKVIILTLLGLTLISTQVNCLFFKSLPLPSCPPHQLFHPCECYLHADNMKIIRCGGHDPYDLMPIFYGLSNYLPKDEKHFHMFYMNNTAIAKLGNVFHDITFDYIYFDGASNLQSINPNTFDITGPYVKEVRAFDTQLQQSSLEDSILGLSNLLHLTVSNVGQCPPEELLKPCKCEYRSEEWQWVQAKFTRIICGEDTEEDLVSLYVQNKNRTEDQVGYYTMRRLQIFFERLSESLNKINWQKRFDEFVLHNSPIVELPRNVFNDIIFYGIRIDNCPKLKTINPLAFTITEPFVQELLIRRTKLANDRWKQRDIFNAITSLTNLRALYLHWSGLQSIPHHAFRPLKGKFQRKLVKISIRYQNNRHLGLRMIGSYAFFYLSNLKSIDLSLNSIVKISRNAFSLRWQSNEALEINLAGNNLSDSSIDPSAFSEAQRPVHVILGQGIIGNPHLQHLDERVFRPFLKENSKNRVMLYSSQNTRGANRISCDCQSRWLFDDFGRIKHGLEDIMCISNTNTSWECLPPCLIFGQELLHCGSNQFFNIRDVFFSLSHNLKQHELHFKRFVLSNTQIQTMPAKSFGDITFEQLEFDGCTNLYQIEDQAFSGTRDNVSKIVVRQTSSLSLSKSHQLKLSSFPNLTHLDLSFDGNFHLFNNTFETDIKSNTTLFIRLNRDNIKKNSIDSNAFNGAKRPIHLFFDSYKDIFDPIGCQLMRLEEEIYAPFLASNPYNQIHIMWCPIVCDCSVKWLFDAPKDWWRRVDAGDSSVGLQCDDHRSLYFYSDHDFRNCPKTNLLKYFETVSPKTPTTPSQLLLMGSTNGMSYETKTTVLLSSDDNQSTTISPVISTGISIENTIKPENTSVTQIILQTESSVTNQKFSETPLLTITQTITENSFNTTIQHNSSQITSIPMTTPKSTEYSLNTVTKETSSESSTKIQLTQKSTESSLKTTSESYTESLISDENTIKPENTSVNMISSQSVTESSITQQKSSEIPIITITQTITESSLNTKIEQNSSQMTSIPMTTTQKSSQNSLNTVIEENMSKISTESDSISKSTESSLMVTSESSTEILINAVTEQKTSETSVNNLEQNLGQSSPNIETTTNSSEYLLKTLTPQKFTESSFTTTNGQNLENITTQRITESSVNTITDETIESTTNRINIQIITQNDKNNQTLKVDNQKDENSILSQFSTERSTNSLITETLITTKSSVNSDESTKHGKTETPQVLTEAITDKMTQLSAQTERPQNEITKHESTDDVKYTSENMFNTITTQVSAEKVTLETQNIPQKPQNTELESINQIETNYDNKPRVTTESQLNDMTQMNTQREKISSESVTENVFNTITTPVSTERVTTLETENITDKIQNTGLESIDKKPQFEANSHIKSEVTTELPLNHMTQVSTQRENISSESITENVFNTITIQDSTERVTTSETQNMTEKSKVITESLLNDMTQVSTQKEMVSSESVTESQSIVTIITEKVSDRTESESSLSTEELNSRGYQESITSVTETNPKSNQNEEKVEEKTESMGTTVESNSEDSIDYLTLDTRNSKSEKFTTTFNTFM